MTVSTPEQHEQRASHDASEGKHNVCQGRLAALADAAVSENSEHYLAGSFSTCDSAALFSAQISTNPLTS